MSCVLGQVGCMRNFSMTIRSAKSMSVWIKKMSMSRVVVSIASLDMADN